MDVEPWSMTKQNQNILYKDVIVLQEQRNKPGQVSLITIILCEMLRSYQTICSTLVCIKSPQKVCSTSSNYATNELQINWNGQKFLWITKKKRLRTDNINSNLKTGTHTHNTLFYSYSLYTTWEHVFLLLYGNIEVVQRRQLNQKKSVAGRIQSEGVHHFQCHHVVFTAGHIDKTAKNLRVEVLEEPTRSSSRRS